MDFTNIGNFNYQISNVPKVSKKEELVTKMFPGFTDKQVKQLYKDTALVPAEKRQEVQQQMYRAILPKLKERDKQAQRTTQKNALYNDVLDEKDTQKVKIKQSAIRVADLADEVRKTVGPIKENDDEIIKKVIDNTPNGRVLFQKYINDGDEEFLYQAGIKERPKPIEGKNPLLRAGEGLIGGVVGAVEGAIEGVTDGFTNMVKDSKRILSDKKKSAPEKFNQILFGEFGADYIGGTIGKTFGGALEGLYEGFTTESERKAVDKSVKGVMESIVQTEPVQSIMKKYNKLDPYQQQELNDIMGYAMNATELVGVGLGAKPIKAGAKVVGEVAKEGLEKTAKITGKIVKNITPTAKVTIDDANNIVGKIIQGSIDDVRPALNTLKNIDTKGIKTYDDLSEVLSSRGKNYMDMVDDKLSKTDKIINSKKAKTTTTVGNTTITQEPVKKGISQLKEMYNAIDDPVNTARIIELEKRFNKQGLSIKEINDVAREYNSQFGKKAFSKMGEPLTSVNAQAFENNRKAIKQFVRDQLPDDTTKMLDKQYSDLINTKQLVDKMKEKVNTLTQKVNKRGMIEKFGRALGRGIDIATGGGLRGALTSFLPSNIGNKVMNSLDLEEGLKSNLKRLDDIIKKLDDGTITNNDIKSLLQ